MPNALAASWPRSSRLGFDAIDLWLGHLNWRWATDEHIAIAKRSLADANLSVSSLAGWFGGTPEEFATACRLSQAMGVSILGGSTGLLDGQHAHPGGHRSRTRCASGL